MPFTYPASQIRGVFVSNPIRNRQSFYPPDAQKMFLDILDRIPYLYSTISRNILPRRKLINAAYELMETYGEIALRVLKSYKSEFAAIFEDVDLVQHFAHDLREIYKAYQKLDDMIEKIIDIAKPDNVFIVSDHGFRPAVRRFYTNQLLKDLGYLRIKAISKLSVQTLLKAAVSAIFPTALSWNDFADLIDWEHTYAYSPFEGVIFLNIKGREYLGCVQPEHVKEIVEKLANDIKVYAKQHGLNIHIWEKTEIYYGRFANYMPEIVIKVPYHVFSHAHGLKSKLSIDIPPIHNYDHTERSILIASGNDITTSLDDRLFPSKVHIVDIAPTILFMYECSIPPYMCGKVLKNIFSNDSGLKDAHVKYGLLPKSRIRIVKGFLKLCKKLKKP